ncbi:hypothetical protein LTR84_011045 [Exophiala bonariae]|uniref:NAD-dependent epimerase/dehydratase domain-containing protein n=1 Tax=Exophiala bonariae TaxID=1690606 RepID=A0AAV9NLT9_9EURO|nr:hypothetical protein LTR84_011045 [Exophiala bonariae]
MASSPRSIFSNDSSENIESPATPETQAFFDLNQHNGNQPEDRYVLVTGGLGFIGSHTSIELLKSGYNIVIIDNLSNSYQSVLDRLIQISHLVYGGRLDDCPKVHFHHFDYQNSLALREVLDVYSLPTKHGQALRSQITGVIHFAAFKSVSDSIKYPLEYYRNNINGLVDFLSVLHDYNIKKFVFSSSATVYGTIADRGIPVREEDCVHEPEIYHDQTGTASVASQGCTGLTNPYGRTKFFGEAILSDLANSDETWRIAALRYFNPVGCDKSGLLGEEPKGIPSNLVPAVTRVLIGDIPSLSVFGDDWQTPDGTAIRDFIHVTDLAQAHIKSLAFLQSMTTTRNFRTYNIGTGQGHSVKQVVRAMEEVSQKLIPIITSGRRPGDVGICVARTDRVSKELGWTAKMTLKEACTDICTFLRARDYF